MNLNEAYKLLNCTPDSTEDELKKSFRKLASKYHPDVNKDPNAEEQFKKFNSALELIKKSKEEPETPSSFFGHPSHGWQDFFTQTIPNKEEIEISTTISFRDAVLGAQVTISYHRDVACQTCHGHGVKFTSKKCSKCQGKGHFTREINHGSQKIMMRQSCHHCQGSGKEQEPCSDCTNGTKINVPTSLNVKIPPGIRSQQQMRLGQQGHHLTQGICAHALLTVIVTPDPELSMDEHGNVTSKISISLLEALQGISKTASTIDGETEITIPKGSRHHDIITLPKLGVARHQDHQIQLQVEYPVDLQPLIQLLTPAVPESPEPMVFENPTPKEDSHVSDLL